MANNLTLRTVNSPYGDNTKGSVLSQQELDDNFIFLKGSDISSGNFANNVLTLTKVNGTNLTFNLNGIAAESTSITGGTYDGNAGIITFTNSTGGTFDVTGITATTVTYTNLNPTTATVGGISAGSTFNAQTMTEMWDALLYPYQAPAFTSFNRSNLSSPYDLGEAILIGSQTFNWGTSNGGNVSANTITIQQLFPSTTTLVSSSVNDGFEVLTLGINISSTTPTTISMYRISAVNSLGSTFTSTISASWRHRWYYGKSPNTSVLASEVTGFTNTLVSSVVNNYVTWGATGSPEYGYLAIPTGLGQPSDLRNSTSGCFGSNIPYSNIGTVTFSNAYGVSTTYNVYRTTNSFAGSQDVWLCS